MTLPVAFRYCNIKFAGAQYEVCMVEKAVNKEEGEDVSPKSGDSNGKREVPKLTSPRLLAVLINAIIQTLDKELY